MYIHGLDLHNKTGIETTASWGPKLAHAFVEWCNLSKFRMISGMSYGLVIRGAV